nr:nucleolar RNA-binding Nop10p-like protein [Ipomoea trifida]GLL30756.1 nucleolar RNA-binding Nop10p-like protein [Ipomoea trifida]
MAKLDEWKHHKAESSLGFSPNDKYSRQRMLLLKKWFGLLPTHKPRATSQLDSLQMTKTQKEDDVKEAFWIVVI